jgi:hypothetical protein
MEIADEKHLIVPVSFYDYKICPSCGKSKVVPLDKYDKEMDIPIYPIFKLKCKACNRTFFPRWIPNDEGELKMVVGDHIQKKELTKIIADFSMSNRRSIHGYEYKSRKECYYKE